MTTGSSTTSASATSTTTSVTFAHPQVSESGYKGDYIVSASAKITFENSTTTNNSVKVYIKQKDSGVTIAEFVFDITSQELQVKSKRVSISNSTVPVYAYAVLIGTNGTVIFSDIKITPVSFGANSYDCVNANTGSGITFDGGGTTWYQAAAVDLTYKSGSTTYTLSSVRFTKKDYDRTLISYYKNSSSYNLWYDDCAIMLSGVSGVKIKLSSSTFSFNAIQYGSLSVASSNRRTIEYLQIKSSVLTKYSLTVTDSTAKTYTETYDTLLRLASSTNNEGLTKIYSYDNYGNITQIVSTSDSNSMLTKRDYGSDGKYLLKEYDYTPEEGYSSYSYDTTNGNLTSSVSPNSQTTSYSYDSDNIRIGSMSATVSGSANSNAYTYSSGLVSALTHNSFNFAFTYNTRNDLTYVKAGGLSVAIMSYSYGTTSYTQTIQYGSTGIKTTYDKYGNAVKWQDETGRTSYGYAIYCDEAATDITGITDPFSSSITVNSASQLKKDYDGINTYYFTYDAVGTLTNKTNNGTINITYKYDSVRRLQKTTAVLYESTVTTSYTYLNGDAQTGDRISNEVTTIGSFTYTSDYTYDGFGRNTVHKITTSEGNVQYTSTFVSHGGVTNGTSEYIHSYVAVVYSGSMTYTDWYSYDKNGNIGTITGQGGNNTVTYGYDGLNRLQRENNLALNQTYFFEYDAGGNITSKKVFAYTTGDLSNPTATYSYTYLTTHKDRLATWNGKSFAYDTAGNPKTYKGETMTWSKGKYLSTYTHNGVAYSFTYNVKGERATKTYNSKTCTFCYVDGKLLYENRPDVGTIYYIYDESGIIGFTLNGTQYYYRKNAQGDILSIHSGGGLYATYTYDAWGNCTVTDNSGTGIGDVNPFRYRGYYYDSETGLYYLMTRYYDPEIGRFISADALAYLAPETINGLNLYAYCYNNPVMGYDPDGTWSWSAFFKVAVVATIIVAAAVIAVASAGTAVGAIAAGAAIGGAMGATVGGVSAAAEAMNNGEDVEEAFADGIFWGGLSGAASGAVAATPLGLGGQIAANAAISGAQYLAQTAVNGDSFDIVDFGISIGSGIVAGVLGGPGFMVGKIPAKAAINSFMLQSGSLFKLTESIFFSNGGSIISTFLNKITSIG